MDSRARINQGTRPGGHVAAGSGYLAHPTGYSRTKVPKLPGICTCGSARRSLVMPCVLGGWPMGELAGHWQELLLCMRTWINGCCSILQDAALPAIIGSLLRSLFLSSFSFYDHLLRSRLSLCSHSVVLIDT